MKESENFWEYSNENAKEIQIIFDNNSVINNWSEYIYIYDSTGTQVHKIYNTSISGKAYTVNDNYIKLTMVSGSSSSGNRGFSAKIFYKSNFK